MPNYNVQQGDCISSISQQHGFDWQALWSHPQNSALRNSRKDPNVLFPDDVVFIPDKQIKQVSASVDATHSFKLKNVPSKLRVRLLKNNVPRSNVKYVLNVDGIVTEGQTDGDGWVEAPIAPDARQGKLTLPDTNEDYPLLLGYLDPIDQVSGMQSRLRSLGYFGGAVSGNMDDATAAALASFQKAKNLAVTGKPDSQTLNALKAAYGS
jgi:hypothetical protein